MKELAARGPGGSWPCGLLFVGHYHRQSGQVDQKAQVRVKRTKAKYRGNRATRANAYGLKPELKQRRPFAYPLGDLSKKTASKSQNYGAGAQKAQVRVTAGTYADILELELILSR